LRLQSIEEEWMALTELKAQTQQDEAVKPTEASLEVTVSAGSSASPVQILAAARDFSAHRAQIWPNVEAKRLEVHERGNGWFLRSALAAIEKTAVADAAINPQTATP
jgi:hypothetical protein